MCVVLRANNMWGVISKLAQNSLLYTFAASNIFLLGHRNIQLNYRDRWYAARAFRGAGRMTGASSPKAAHASASISAECNAMEPTKPIGMSAQSTVVCPSGDAETGRLAMRKSRNEPATSLRIAGWVICLLIKGQKDARKRFAPG